MIENLDVTGDGVLRGADVERFGELRALATERNGDSDEAAKLRAIDNY